jgi:hypothetical protein
MGKLSSLLPVSAEYQSNAESLVFTRRNLCAKNKVVFKRFPMFSRQSHLLAEPRAGRPKHPSSVLIMGFQKDERNALLIYLVFPISVSSSSLHIFPNRPLGLMKKFDTNRCRRRIVIEKGRPTTNQDYLPKR